MVSGVNKLSDCYTLGKLPLCEICPNTECPQNVLIKKHANERISIGHFFKTTTFTKF